MRPCGNCGREGKTLDQHDLARPLAAFISGALLSLGGSLVQGVTQNEMAAPSTLGFNAYTVLIILFCHGLTLLWPFSPSLEYLSFAVFLGLTILLHIGVARKAGQNPLRYGNKSSRSLSFFILIGLCFNLFIGALFSLLQFSFMTLNLEFPSQLWFGNFRFMVPGGLWILIPYFLFLYGWAFRLSKKLRVMSFGTDLALGLGLPVKKLQVEALFLALYAEGIVDSFYGLFSFIGLIFPHLLRTHSFFRTNLQREIVWGSLLCGLLFLLFDLFCQQVLILGAEIPAGMVTSLVGTFFMMGLLLKGRMKAQGPPPFF